MTDFASLPPSIKRESPKGFFQGGMMPATSQNVAAMIVIDVRSLRLTAEQGKVLEKAIREFAFKQLGDMKVDLSGRSALDLSTSVFGISIE